MDKSKTKINWSRIGLKVAIPLFIFIFNLIIVAPLLSGEFASEFHSEQPVYVKIFDFVNNNWPDVFWVDFWHGGFPFVNGFSPFILFGRVLGVFGSNFGHILRMLSALCYALVPVTLYYFVKVITKRRLTGLIAAFSFSLLPTFSALFFPQIMETSAEYFHAPWHFIVNVYGDTLHTFSLVLLPLLGACFYKTLRHPSFKKIILCSLFIVLLALVDFITLFSAVILLFILMFSEVLNSRNKTQSRLGVFVICIIIAFGLISFWYHPGFYSYFFSKGPGFEVTTNLLQSIPYLVLLIPWLIIGVFYIFGFRKHLQAFFIAWGWFTLTFTLTFSYFIFGRNLVPEAHRYLIELNMSLCIILAVVATLFFDWIGRVEGRKHRFVNFFRFLFLAGYILTVIFYSSSFIRNSWSFNNPKNIENETAYQVGAWLEANDQLKQGRIYLQEGKNWFNLSTDQTQISCPLENINHNTAVSYIDDKISETNDPELLEIIAKATNTTYFFFPKDSDKDEMLESFSEVIHNFDGQKLYQTNFESQMAVKVKINNISDLRNIDWEVKKEDLKKYVDWQREVEGEVEYIKEGSQRFLIKADIEPGEAILVKMDYNNGFKAKSGEDNLAIKKDSLGFMLILPEKTGEQEIVLTYGFSFNQWLGLDITLLTIFFLVFYRLRPKIKILRRGWEEYDTS